MSTKLKIGLAAALVIGTLYTLFQIVWVDINETDAKLPIVGQGLTEQPTVEATEKASTPETTNNSLAAVPANPEPARTQLAPANISISGKVTEKDTGHPVKAFRIVLRDREEDRTIIQETVRDEKGRFSFPLEKGGRYMLSVQTSRHVSTVLSDLDVPEEEGLAGLLIELDPGMSISGRVVEDATGKSVAGALIGTDGRPGGTNLFAIHSGDTEACLHTESDKEGRFTLSGLGEKKQKIAAMHSDYAEAWVEVTPGDVEEIELRLIPGFRIFGKAFSDDGKPASGTRIDAIYRGIPIQHSRDVLTGPDGSYQTVPFSPGRVDLHVRQGRTAPGSPTFTSEQIAVEIIDRDVEVNFGEMDKFVTWRGTFFDFEGNPVSKGQLTVRTASRSGMYSGIPPLRLQCDEHGRFELLKIQPGYYKVRSERGPKYTGTDSVIFTEFHFPRPGLVERDIRASGAIVNGRVIDGRTREPMAGKPGKVMAKLETDTNIHIKTALDGEGNFSMKGIPAGTYVIWAEVSGKKSRELDGIVINENQVINNFEIEVFEGGWLKIKVSGCLEEPWFDLLLEHAGESGPPVEYNYTTRDGILEESLYLETGHWIATICFRQSGMLERRFEILPDKDTELSFDWKELILFEGTLTIEGSLTCFDGTPLVGARVLIGPVRVPGLEENRWHDLYTDERGRFIDAEARPGRWNVTIQHRERGQPDIEYRFPDLQIPNNPVNPFPLDLVLPSGRVKGTFFDLRKEDAFGERGPWWQVFLLDATRKSKDDRERDLVVCELKDSGGSRFEMEGVPAGKYHLKIEISGYHIHCSAPFTLKEGQKFDAGKIGLEPCGLLNLEVVNQGGKPVEWYDLFCNGEKCTYRWNSPPGLLWEKLPLGDVDLRIHKKGFKDHALTVHLEPYQQSETKVVMESE